MAAATLRACQQAERLADHLAQLRASWRARVLPRRGSAAELLLDVLVRAPVVTATTAATLVSRSTVAAGNVIDQLVEAGVLTQTTVGKRNRAFEAHEVFDLLVDDERELASPTGDTSSEPPARMVPVRRARRGQ